MNGSGCPMSSILQLVNKYSSIVLLCLFYVSGCNQHQYPINATEKFWQAMQEKDIDALRKVIDLESLGQDDLIDNILPISNVSLSRTIIDGEYAWVDTTVQINGDNTYSVPLKTKLLQKNGRWKVDYDATIKGISLDSELAKLITSIHTLSIQFSEDFKQTINELQKKIPEVQREMKKIEEQMKLRIPVLKKKMEEFVRELEEALKSSSEKIEQPIEI